MEKPAIVISAQPHSQAERVLRVIATTPGFTVGEGEDINTGTCEGVFNGFRVILKIGVKEGVFLQDDRDLKGLWSPRPCESSSNGVYTIPIGLRGLCKNLRHLQDPEKRSIIVAGRLRLIAEQLLALWVVRQGQGVSTPKQKRKQYVY